MKRGTTMPIGPSTSGAAGHGVDAGKGRGAQAIDIGAIKRAHRIADVVAGYGVALRPSGRALVGRCPFHPDAGRPNLHVYVGNESWYCYRCAVGGDVLDFVRRVERVDFRAAAGHLAETFRPTCAPAARPSRTLPLTEQAPRGPAELACLAAAAELYANRLLSEPRALAYARSRGLDGATLGRCRVGYAAGDELADFLRWRRLPLQGAVRAGLLRRDGSEVMAGRVVVPELRAGAPVWLIGRTLVTDASGPKFLGLPGRKPLLGWERACGARAVVVVEGVFDLLTLDMWGIPAVALLGTYPSLSAATALARFGRVYLALDADEAGQEAGHALAQRLGSRASLVRLPALPGVEDVADLAPRAGGRDAFLGALRESARSDRQIQDRPGDPAHWSPDYGRPERPAIPGPREAPRSSCGGRLERLETERGEEHDMTVSEYRAQSGDGGVARRRRST